MKTKLFAVAFFALMHNQIQSHAITSVNPAVRSSNFSIGDSNTSKICDPLDIRVVVSQKRIWLIADEMPMKCLKTLIKNAEGKVVLEKCFSSKCAEWFLNIEALPKGEYTLYLGDRVEKFKK